MSDPQILAASALVDALFDEPGAGRCLVDPDGRVVRASQAWLRFIGLPPGEVLGAALDALLPELGGAAAASRSGSARVDLPRLARRAEGREAWWEASVAPVAVDGGTGLLVTAREVASPASAPSAEDALRESEARFRAIFENATDAIILSAPEGRGRILSVNPAACRMFGYSEEEFGRLDRSALVDTERELEDFLQSRDAAGHAGGELTYRRKDGTRFKGELTSALFADRGHLRAVAVIRDVTQQRRADAALRAREKDARARAVELEAILECVADGVIVYDREGRTIRSTPAADHILGIPPSERLAPVQDRVARQYEVVSEDGRHLSRDEMIAVRAAVHGEALRNVILRVRSGQSEPRWLAMNALPLVLDGAHAGAVLSMTDITDRKNAEQELKRAEQALREANAQLREADRRKDEFLGMLSHELRNPLAPIRNSVYVLRHTQAGSEQATRAQGVIERQIDHLTRLVDDLLDVTRIARGKIELRRTRVDLREVVSRAAEDFRVLMRDRAVAFHVLIPGERLWADADATRVTQVVGNLLHNASKFTRPGDEVTLSVEVSGDAAELRVRDSGAGIEPSLLPQVFDPFVQGTRTLARTEGGLGLGLALVKGITELHGGTVRVESGGKGQGAEFVVRLPLAAAAGTSRRSDPAPRPNGALRVLVVDDNVDAAESLADVARMLGHGVEVAFDGPSALEKALASPPDAVLCDLGLPGISGYEVARALRSSGRARPLRLIAISGYAQPEDVKKAVEAGFDAHVAKPCDPEEIARLLAS